MLGDFSKLKVVEFTQDWTAAILTFEPHLSKAIFETSVDFPQNIFSVLESSVVALYTDNSLKIKIDVADGDFGR